MPGNLSGIGVGLPFPQFLYPSELANTAYDSSTNRIALGPGDSFVVPAGDWIVGLGMYTVLQFLDPLTNVWTTASGAAWTRGMTLIASDGFNVRVANLTGCVVSASVINGGTNYVQATTTITAIGSFVTGVAVPTLVPIVGGALGAVGTLTSTNAGAGYGVAPLILIPPPPPAQANANGVGGIQAAAAAVISGGTISSISILNMGAGYPTAPVPVVVPSPFDPNLAVGITNATVAFSLTSSGVIMGALVTNNGGPLINGSLASVTLSVGGAGASGSLTANVMQTVVTASVATISTGFSGLGMINTAGGAPLPGTITNSPFANFLEFEPRPANIVGTLGTLSLAAVYDGGLFESAPTIALGVGPGATNTVGIAVLTMGGRSDITILQPGP